MISHADFRAARRGDKAAIARVLASYDGLARQKAYEVARRNRAIDFDDLLQEARLGLMRALRTYDPSRTTFVYYGGQWALAYARLAARQFRRRATRETSEPPWPHIDPPDESPLPDEELAEVTRGAELREAVLRLRDDRERSAVLGFMRGQTHQRVGDAMGVSRQTANNAFHRGLHKLRSRFKPS